MEGGAFFLEGYLSAYIERVCGIYCDTGLTGNFNFFIIQDLDKTNHISETYIDSISIFNCEKIF